ncbi:hypothetical protein ALON55S_04158 [Alishewanella longhuensis]
MIPQQIAHKPEDIQYSAATHLQALLLQTGMAFDDSEQLVRAALGLFSHNVLALVPASHDANLNNRLLQLASKEGIDLSALLLALKEELLQTEQRPYYLPQLANWQPLRLASNEVTLIDGVPVTVVADASSLLPLNSNYSLELYVMDIAANSVSAGQYELLIDKPGEHIVMLSVLNNQLASRDAIFSETLNAGAQQQLALKETEDENQLALAGGLLVSAADVVQNGSNWSPVQVSSTRSDELLAISVEQLAGPVTFTYQYSPSAVPNPLELMIVVEDAFNSRLIAPDSVDYLNNTVTFTYQPATNAPQLAAMGTTKANSNRVMLHIRQVKGAPTGKDIDDLLDGRRSYLEQAVRAGLGIVTDLRRDISSEQQAINALIEPLYSNNSAVKAIARAKLTKVLQQRQPNGDYAYYDQFTTAINMAVAAEVLENIRWDDQYIKKWLAEELDCVSKITPNCWRELRNAYEFGGAKLLNEGLSLYLGASTLSARQSANHQLLKHLITLSIDGVPTVLGSKYNGWEFVKISVAQNIVAFTDENMYGYSWTAAAGLVDVLRGATTVKTVGISLFASWTGNFIAKKIELETQNQNVRAYTPIIFALQQSKSRLFENAFSRACDIAGAPAWECGTFVPSWSLGAFKETFFNGPYQGQSANLQAPKEIGWINKSWASQFGEVL